MVYTRTLTETGIVNQIHNIRHYVELIAISLRIEQFVHDLDHKVTHPFDSFRGELMYYNATEAVVIWWV